MSTLSSAVTLPEWQAFSAKDPAGAAHELTRRMQTQLPDDQNRAVFSWIQTERELTSLFERSVGSIAPLAGVPYALKDLFHVLNTPLRAGSRLPSGLFPKRDRDGKLPHVMRGAGAVLAAKTQLHELAYGLTGENPYHGDCVHPSYPDRTSGGSSSGSAVTVAAGIVPFAVGTDTGGSIRVPAAFCGLYGLRLAPRHPWSDDIFPLAPGFDTAGWFTGNAADMITLHRYMIGVAKSEREPRGAYLDFAALGQPADDDVADAFRQEASRYADPADADTAARLRDTFSRSAATYAVLQSIEAYQVHAAWLDVHRPAYSPSVWERIDRGRNWTAEQISTAQKDHTALLQTWADYFAAHDFLILPSTPFPALLKADCTPENRNRLLALNAPASLGGLPVLALPVTLPSGLTTGLQVIVPKSQSPVIPWALHKAG